jgi:hypothetical protein
MPQRMGAGNGPLHGICAQANGAKIPIEPRAHDRYTQDQTIGGELAEWLRSGLQIRVHEFDSRTRLQ